MKRSLVLLVTLFISLVSFSQIDNGSFIGKKYSDFYEKMLIDQKTGKNPSVMIGEPIKKYEGKEYTISILWKDVKTEIIIAQVLLFDKNDTCVQIMAFVPLNNFDARKTFLLLCQTGLDTKFIKKGEYWFEYKKDLTVRYYVNENEISGIKGIVLVAEKF